MRTDLGDQIHELIEHGLRPVSMTDIENRSPVRVTTVRRAIARSGPGHGRLILAGAAGIAACAVLAVATLLPGSGGSSNTRHARLAAWTVAEQPDGSAMVTLHRVRDPARLQQTLHADGIPARVFVNRQQTDNSLIVPGCHVYPLGVPGGTPLALWQRVFYGPHANVRSYTFWVYPSALPPGRGVVIVIHYGRAKLSNDSRSYPVGTDLGYGVNSYSLYLVNATPKCTGSAASPAGSH
jgi:hypothetical protein